jgi:hypothetical protein
MTSTPASNWLADLAARINANPVDTKRRTRVEFGNDAVGFIRVRKRKLKGGSTYSRQALASASYDLVRAVRVNGKPRHQFVLGLGSQKEETDRRARAPWFWFDALDRMTRHGLTAPQRQRLVAEMVRKGARLPTIEQCQGYAGWGGRIEAALPELISIIEAAA